MKAVVVTGATGSLGRPLCARLARGGWEVRALVRDPARVPGMRAGRCDLPDVIDESLLPGAFALVHCAYATRETDQERARRVNEDGMRRLLEASRRAGIPRFVFISSVVAHPEAPNYYGRSKASLERLLDPQRDLVVRPGTIIAREGQSIFQQMRDAAERTHVLPVFGGGKQPLQTVHIDDVCEAAGYTRGAFYSNFGTLDELFFALYDERAAIIASQVADALTVEQAAPIEPSIHAVIARTATTLLLDRDWLLVKTDFLLYAARRPEVATWNA